MEKVKQIILPVKKDSLVDQVHDHMLELIIQGEAPDDSVFTEGGLVQQFGVSKTTVREALVRLCNEKVLKSIPRCGYMLVRMDQKEAENLVDFRLLLEEGALREGFDRITEQNLQAVSKLLDQHVQNPTLRVWDVWQKNIEFHSLLVSFAGNPVYVEYLQRAMRSQSIYFGRSRWGEQRSFEDHITQQPHIDIYTALCHDEREKALVFLRKDIGWVS